MTATQVDPRRFADPWRDLAPHLAALAALVALADPHHADQREVRLDYHRLNELVTLLGEASESMAHLVDVAASWLPEEPQHDAAGHEVPGPIRAGLANLLATLGEVADVAQTVKTDVEQMDAPE